MGKTSIGWTRGDDGSEGRTWNPVRGCSRVSEGCRNCYAERVAARFSGPGQPYEGLAKIIAPRDHLDRVGGRRNGWTGVVRAVPEHLADPLKWRKPARVFVNSMSDLFHERLGNEEIAAVFGVMAAATRHTFQVLTKRAERMRDWFRWVASVRPHADRTCGDAAENAGAGVYVKGRDGRSPWNDSRCVWPLPNVHLGVSAENQKYADERIPLLLESPAAVRFVSYEPALGPIDFTRVGEWRGESLSALEEIVGHVERPKLSWIIYGDESGPGARPADPRWARSTVRQCRGAGVPVFVKQIVLDGKLRRDMAEFPEDIRFQEFPQ